MPLTLEQLSHFGEQLERMRDSLLEAHELAVDGVPPVEHDQATSERRSPMEATQARAVSAARQQRREFQLQRVSQALNRMATGKYELCEVCCKPINPLRLEFDPAESLCLECASLREQGERAR